MQDALKQIISSLKCVLLDLDGTIYLDGEPLGDMKNTLEALRKTVKLVFLSNNSSRSKSEYEERLLRTGLYTEKDDIYTSLDATVELIVDKYKDSKVYAVATKKVRDELEERGVILDENNPDIVLLCYDTELNYRKLCKISLFLSKGAYFIATHPDNTCPAKDVFVPDVGSFLKLIECATGRSPDIIVGKPYNYMGEGIKKRYEVNNCQIMMVGDRLSTDIAFGNNCGFHSMLVLSGETDSAMAERSEIKPEFTLSDLNEIVKYL